MDGVDGVDGVEGTDGMDGVDGIEGVLGVEGILGVDGAECTPDSLDGTEGVECEDSVVEVDDDFIIDELFEGLREGTLLRVIVAPKILPIAPLLALAALIAVEPADSLHSALYFPTSKVDVG